MRYALILAGGVGRRMQSSLPKQFLRIAGIPLIGWSLRTFQQMDEIDGIVITCGKEYFPLIKDVSVEYSISKLLACAESGNTRQLSCKNALEAIPYRDTDIVLIHDAARPFVSQEIVRACILAAEQFGAASTYVPINDTIAEVHNDFVQKTVPRESLRAAQTPQCFRYSIIRAAHARAQELHVFDATDDVSLLLLNGGIVRAVDGDSYNIKITTPEDFALAEIIATKIMRK
ncbi:MAG: 2-C-methyl-D-erythritol 4-phosphate cytidylyltransferase [Spirochaetes bacterium]|nr:2-C-methyl-D-erythritol 4-phosphate cytidylyltransferase [Spirochaetota bacterium]